MTLQKLRHSKKDDMIGEENDIVIVHGVNEIELGGEYTICGRAIPDSVFEAEGWEAVGPNYKGSIKDCNCQSCLRIIAYFKRLR